MKRTTFGLQVKLRQAVSRCLRAVAATGMPVVEVCLTRCKGQLTKAENSYFGKKEVGLDFYYKNEKINVLAIRSF
jgi:hypothetical protein